MYYESRLSISYYKTIATINESHKIYLVRHQETGKLYVKKVLDIYNLDVYRRLKETEYSGIPKIMEYAEDGNSLILIEEYISGETLAEKITAGSLTEKSIVEYVSCICDTVTMLHSMNPPIIHRDIKPANVIIDRYDKPILLDFNAAKNYTGEAPNDTVLLGTQGFAAPEQYGFGSSSPQTDIYSIGILLKEMAQSLPKPTAVFDAVIERCTQMDPKNRYQTVKALKKAVISVSKGGSAVEASHSVADFMPPGFRTKKGWKIAVASIVYVFIFWLCLTLEVDGISAAALWTERIFCLAMMLSVVAGSFNYRNIHRFFPLCRHQNRFLRYLGILLLDFCMVAFLFLLMVVIESCFLQNPEP